MDAGIFCGTACRVWMLAMTAGGQVPQGNQAKKSPLRERAESILGGE